MTHEVKLDELEALYEAATAAGLRIVDGEIWAGVPLFRPAPKGGRLWGGWIEEGELEALAALIVALHNAFPAIMAALREQEWRDISTAPKDGTRVLLATTTGGIQTGEWCARQYEWVAQTWDDWGQSAVDGEPTHWRPLPAPPSKGT